MLTVDSNYNIQLTRGDTGIFTIELTDEDGNAFTPSTGDSLRFAMSNKYGSTKDETLILKDIPIDTLAITIDPEDTKSLEFKKYYYDIEYTDAAGNVSTILIASFTVTKEVY